jgi:hypothetical protein
LIVDFISDGILDISAYLALDDIIFLSDALYANGAFLVHLIHACSSTYKSFPEIVVHNIDKNIISDRKISILKDISFDF